MSTRQQSIEAYQDAYDGRGTPERNLFSAVLLCAVNDVATGPMGECLHAYDWVMELHPAFRMYCVMLDIDPITFRDQLFKLHGSRAERYRRIRENRRRGRSDTA